MMGSPLVLGYLYRLTLALPWAYLLLSAFSGVEARSSTLPRTPFSTPSRGPAKAAQNQLHAFSDFRTALLDKDIWPV
ncbi:hypothetical protein EDB86DRAFT_2934946, partial [Lactarius hatsudake]